MDGAPHQSQLDSRLRQYQALVEVAESIAAHRDLSSLLHDLRDRLRRVVRSSAVHLILHDAEQNLMRRHILDPAFPPRQIPSAGLAMEDAPAGWVWQTQQPMLIQDIPAIRSRYPHVVAELEEYGIKTIYILPLSSLGRRLGALAFISSHESAWSEDDQEILRKITKLVALAVDNVINFESALTAQNELKRRIEHLRLLLEVGKSIVSHLDFRELIAVIAGYLRQVIRCDGVWLSLCEADPTQIRVYALDAKFADADSRAMEGRLIPLEDTPAADALTSLQTILVTRERLERSRSPIVKRILDQGVNSGCIAPLISHGRPLGAIAMVSLRENAFGEEDAELLTQIARQIAVAVENATNFERARAAEEQAKRHSERLQMLLEINNAMVSNLDLPTLMKTISSVLRKVAAYDSVGLALHDAEANQLRGYGNILSDDAPFVEEGQPIPLEGSMVGLSFTSGEAVFLDRLDDERFQSDWSRRFRDAGFKSAGCVPLISHNRKLGVLGVATRRETHFSDDEAQLLWQVGNQVAIAVENALAFREIETLKNKLTSEKLYLEAEIRTEHNFEELIGTSPSFKRILKQIETVAPTESTVLIRGETGTGKELIARAIHNLSARRERALVKINCAAIPTGLLESELFGHEKGAFTGAITQRIGRFELAHRGTLFLDEVGDIPFELQPKLLRVLQEQEFERLGSTRTQKVDVRLIAATNSDLEQMVADKKYRSDLYYRLNVFPVTIPPLRDRREDIPALARFFTQKYASRLKKRIEAIPADVMNALTGYHWPGNVRELEHFIERAVVLTQSSDLEISFSELKQSAPAAASNISTLEEAEREHILRALEESNWTVGGPNGAAARLGMKRTTLQSRIQKLGLERGKPRSS
jgi:formate hydrogenlyase transcriptional activator